MVTTLSIRFTAIRSNVKYLKTGQIARQADKYTKDWCKELIEETKTYPPELLVPSYRRTHNLERSWKVVKRGGSGISYEVQNMVRDKYGRFYARLVHGGPLGDGQWGFHGDHDWILLFDAANDIMGGRPAFRDGVQRIFTKYAT